MENNLFYCYSPALSEFLQSKGLRYLGIGLNIHSGKKFWQFERGIDLDKAISEWQANNPNKRRR